MAAEKIKHFLHVGDKKTQGKTDTRPATLDSHQHVESNTTTAHMPAQASALVHPAQPSPPLPAASASAPIAVGTPEGMAVVTTFTHQGPGAAPGEAPMVMVTLPGGEPIAVNVISAAQEQQGLAPPAASLAAGPLHARAAAAPAEEAVWRDEGMPRLSEVQERGTSFNDPTTQRVR